MLLRRSRPRWILSTSEDFHVGDFDPPETNSRFSPSRSTFVVFPSGRVIRFFVAVRKITRSHSQVKRLTIEMPIGNYVRDTCEALIRRIADREQLQSIEHQLVLEFGDKRLRQQRTLASYGVQNGDLLFLFNPEQRLSFLAYGDDDDGASPLPSQPPLGVRVGARPRSNSYNSSASDIRTATSVDMGYNRTQQALRTISGRGDSDGSLNSDD